MEESKLMSKCSICEKVFSQHDLEAHFLECDQNHKCKKCGKIFQTIEQLNSHNAVHEITTKKNC